MDDEVCEWRMWWGIDCEYYITTCDNAFQFFSGTPKENNFSFCPYCGKKLAEIEEKEPHENI